jgi:hypothetical protein
MTSSRLSIGTRTLAVLALTGGLLGLSVPAAHAQKQNNGPCIDALDRVFQRATTDFASYGIDNSVSSNGSVYRAIGGAWLKKGEAKIGVINLTPGIEYVVIAASDQGVQKASLKILDAKRKPSAKEGDEVITESSEDSSAPGCTVNLSPEKYGTKPYALGVRMLVETMKDDADNQSRPGGWVCFLVLKKEAGLRIPTEHFTEALRNLETRLSALALKNSGGAGVASDSIALSGTALPPNASVSLSYSLSPGKKFQLIAAGEDRTEALSITIGGNLTAPTGSLGTERPRLTFLNKLPVPTGSTAAWKATNKSKTEGLVLTALIRIGQ